MASTEYRLSAKRVQRNVMQVELSEQELWESERFQKLQRQIQDLQQEVSEST
jgi:hypothetical protein